MRRALLISCTAGALLCAHAHAQSDDGLAPGDEAPPAQVPVTVDPITEEPVTAGEATAERPIEQAATRPTITDPQDLPVRRRSYIYPAGQILFMTTGLQLTLRAMGVPWVETTRESIKNNLTLDAWHFDSDPYTINNAGHPYCGALLFAAARSTGHNWWVSGLYAFGGSAVWETIMEIERPSLNDQLSTPIGGMFIGEIMHRTSRALLYPGYGKPGYVRKGAAWLIDPVGSFDRATWGDAWAKTIPPSMYAHFALGVQQATRVIGENGSGQQFHTSLFFEHGLTGDRAFQPERAMDHFELRASIDASTDDADFGFNVRGMLLGTGRWTPRLRGMAGLFGAFDFDNQEYTRASMLGVGPGGTAEVQIGRYGYVEGTVAAYAVPWGAAGGVHRAREAGSRSPPWPGPRPATRAQGRPPRHRVGALDHSRVRDRRALRR